jgi:serine O-acetyltransferase
MIQTRKDLNNFLKEDRIALGLSDKTFKLYLKGFLFPNYILKFQRLLRKCEYHKNNSKSVYHLLLFAIYYRNFHQLSAKLGFSIPLNIFGPGLAIVHYGTIVISPNARIGANCRIHPSTCIGASGGSSKAPIIGDNIYVGPGVKIYGDIQLGNNIAIAANAAVSNNFLEDNILIGGIPAKKIKDFDISSIIKHIKK